jgi:hypothetical protein
MTGRPAPSEHSLSMVGIALGKDLQISHDGGCQPDSMDPWG